MRLYEIKLKDGDRVKRSCWLNGAFLVYNEKLKCLVDKKGNLFPAYKSIWEASDWKKLRRNNFEKTNRKK